MSQPTTDIVTIDKYFQFLSKKQLMGSKCHQCHQIFLPPRRLCSHCMNETQWFPLSGKGSLQTFSSIYVGTKTMISKGYNRQKPYVFAVAKMDEGPCVSGQLIGVDETKPDLIKIGMLLKVTYLSTEIGKDKENNPVYRWDVGFEPQ